MWDTSQFRFYKIDIEFFGSFISVVGSKISHHMGNNHNNQGCIRMTPLNIFTVSFIFAINISHSKDQCCAPTDEESLELSGKLFCDLTLATFRFFLPDDYALSILTLLKLQNEA